VSWSRIRLLPCDRQARATRSRSELAFLALAALGVVYGDIGTSPLYCAQGVLQPVHGLAPTRENVMGVMSLVFWR
jgi:KUP system potassium uptake protein